MSDLRLHAPGEFTRLDLELEGGDLALDESLATAALASLFTDALARAEDALPAEGDRRGWWAEALAPGERDEVFGSRLWLLLERSKLTRQALLDAEVYAREALQWLVDRGVLARVEATASRLDTSAMLLEVVLVRGQATARPELWAGTLRLALPIGPARLELLAVP